MDRDAAREKVVARLTQWSARGRRISITDDTEIYYDLRLFGDDLYEFVVWVGKELVMVFPLFGGDHRRVQA